MRRPQIALIFLLLISGTYSYAQTSWTLVKTDLHEFGTQFATRFINEQYGFILPLAGGMWPGSRTTDGGKTWIRCIGNVGSPVKDLQWSTASKLYCATQGSQFFLYSSEDSGRTWNFISNINTALNQLYVKGDSIYVSKLYSYDGGKKLLPIPMADFRDGNGPIAGNKDNSIVFCGDGRIDHGSVYTTDYGQHWNKGQVGDNIFALYSVPYTATYFRATDGGNVSRPATANTAFREDSSFVERSTDHGKTWVTVLETTDPTNYPMYLTGAITGGNCAVYVKGAFKHPPSDFTEFPCYQSTDLGKTWKNIGGPANYAHNNISAVARGAILYVGDGHGGLWKFTDSSLLRPATADMEIEKLGTGISADTIYASACDTALVQLNYSFRACDYVLMDSLSVEGISEYAVSYRKGHVLMDGRPDTAQVSFFPPTSGTYHIKIHTRVQRDDWVLEDTALQLVLVVKPNPGSLSTAPTDTLDLGSQVLCQLHLDSNYFYLSAHGCEAVKVTGMYFEPDPNSAGEFGFVPVSSFTLGATDPSKLFTIHFLPKTIGIKHGRVIIETTTGNDTIFIKGTVLPGGILLSPSEQDIQFGVVSNCTNPIDSIITLTNHGCDTLRITQGPGNLPPEFQLLPPFQLPIILPPDSSVVVHFRFAPTKKGSYTATPRFHAEQQGLTQDISVTLEGNGIEEGGLLSYSPKQFSFPSLSICAHDSASGSITNIG
ncbi:MAG TPA: sialidase family protein, partial [Candidatus Kapabacteria bacterium]|nr:sialidase family protein [Candidatus Kapabacteria bacterium]